MIEWLITSPREVLLASVATDMQLDCQIRSWRQFVLHDSTGRLLGHEPGEPCSEGRIAFPLQGNLYDMTVPFRGPAVSHDESAVWHLRIALVHLFLGYESHLFP